MLSADQYVFTLGHICLSQLVIGALVASASGSFGCAPTVVTKCSIAVLTASGGLYFSSMSAFLRASSGLLARMRLSLAMEMSRQVDASGGAACADEEVAGGEAGAAELVCVTDELDEGV